MRISDILKTNKVTVSCEMFPPKPGKPLENTQQVVHEIAAHKPSFMSVTYGAGGSNSKNTLSIAEEVQKSGVTALAHLTCVGQDEENLRASINAFKASGIENILALRGDIPEGGAPESDFTYAADLIRYIKETTDFDVAAACYPEKHTECESLEKDIEHLKQKVDCGVGHLISQLFFHNEHFYDFCDKIEAKGITVPVTAGIMPITNQRQMERMASMCGAQIPEKYRLMMEKYGGDQAAIREAGIIYALEQIVDLIANGVRGIHIYTMNNPLVARKISMYLQNILTSVNEA